MRAPRLCWVTSITGEGVEKDYGKAFEWYKEAALQGHAGSQASLGYLYGEGHGVERNLKQAYAWSTLAAENGSDRGSKTSRSTWMPWTTTSASTV